MARLGFAPMAFLALLAAAMPARACINDREVNRTEREFKSQYQEFAPASESSQPSQGQTFPVLFMVGGAALLLGATVTVLNPPKRPRPE